MHPFQYGQTTSVSIHAPTRGATKQFEGTSKTIHCFNPRTHTGCDLMRLATAMGEKVFQSTHPHGVRLSGLKGAIVRTQFQSTHPHGVRQHRLRPFSGRVCFNPRTHTGCDSFVSLCQAASNVSIHAPTRGATSVMQCTSVAEPVSIHAPTRGATSSYQQYEYKISVSIHAPTRGATPSGAIP